ncbi:hypothetical protein PoB_005077600 [Plakobranchus ocellatus]|uniref:Uncharacterized protein n=1 Tax=Plakobranchus ocellatus TaxID=259542 RepID=A0AAV4BYT0_9GAST|nr:hypothetical protein PoB_005077600 [Plakobranchus ocellatus]
MGGWVSSGESIGGEESNGKQRHKAVCQDQPQPYSWFPDAWTLYFIFTSAILATLASFAPNRGLHLQSHVVNLLYCMCPIFVPKAKPVPEL